MRNIGRWGVLFGSALMLAVAVLAAPNIHDPGGGGRVIALAVSADLDQAAADLKATIAMLEVVDIAPSKPAANTWSVAAVTGDGVDLTKRMKNLEQGGRVKSASSLLVSPASRYSARV
jgi:hypothetical protein